MRYSYMPTRESRGKSTALSVDTTYWIDSEERALYFRNQYGELFLMLSRGTIRWMCLISLVIGITIGRII